MSIPGQEPLDLTLPRASSRHENSIDDRGSNIAGTRDSGSSAGTHGVASAQTTAGSTHQSVPEASSAPQNPITADDVVPFEGPTTGGIKVVILGQNFPLQPIFARFGESDKNLARIVSSTKITLCCTI